MDLPASAAFADVARDLCDEVRRHGLVAPAFCAPPRVAGAERTIRRLRGGGVMVAVRVRGRPLDEVAADMVDGVIAANGLRGREARAWRLALRASLGGPPLERAA